MRQRKETARINRQHFKRRDRKQGKKSIEKLLAKEQADITDRTRWTEASVLNRIETTYGFVEDHIKIKLHNAALHLSSMRSWYYFDRPKNLAFHDLCTEIEPNHNLWSLLGLGLKFCPAPQFTYNKSTETLKYFKRELYPKTYHTGVDGNYDYNHCMYVSHTWMPQWWQVPNEIPRIIKEF